MQLTAANSDAEVDTLVAALEELADRGALRMRDAVESGTPAPARGTYVSA